MSIDPNMLALGGMMAGGDQMMMDDSMPPMDPMMGGEMADPEGVTEIPVPNWAVPAVLELLSLLEEADAAGIPMGDVGAEMGAPMGGEMGMPMDAGMGEALPF